MNPLNKVKILLLDYIIELLLSFVVVPINFEILLGATMTKYPDFCISNDP